jgi:hypothetical protein
VWLLRLIFFTLLSKPSFKTCGMHPWDFIRRVFQSTLCTLHLRSIFQTSHAFSLIRLAITLEYLCIEVSLGIPQLAFPFHYDPSPLAVCTSLEYPHLHLAAFNLRCRHFRSISPSNMVRGGIFLQVRSLIAQSIRH